MDPFAGDAFFNIGYASYLKGDFNAAEKNLVESLQLRGRDSEALYLLGRTYEKQGRLQDARRMTARATRLSQRVERWQNQPLPNLERVVMMTNFRAHEEVWNDRRLARRARSLDLPAWLELVQADADLYSFGDALRELRDLIKIFPDSSEGRSLLKEIERQ